MKTFATSHDDEMEAFMPRTNTSLFRLSIIAIVTRMWSCGALNDVLQSVIDAKRSLSEDCFYLTQKMECLVRRLGLPSIILDEVLMITEWISHDLILYLNGLVRNEFFFYTGAVGDIIKNIKWDVQGTINEVVTFRNMSYVNSHYNYILSTIFCLEDDVSRMWHRCTQKEYLLDTMQSGDFSYAKYVILYWTCRVSKKDAAFQICHFHDPQQVLTNLEHNSLDLKMLIISLHIFNVHSYKYFWRKLDEKERQVAFSILCDTYAVDDLFTPEEDYILRQSVSIILFTFLHLDEQQRLTFVHKCYYQLIVQFWEYWPIHHAILPIFKMVVPRMDENTYTKLFAHLLKSIGPYSPRDKLLLELWSLSPSHLQRTISERDKKEMLKGYDERRFAKKLLQILN